MVASRFIAAIRCGCRDPLRDASRPELALFGEETEKAGVHEVGAGHVHEVTSARNDTAGL
jgi:hypothetical protein